MMTRTHDTCPICGEKWVSRCKCIRMDSTCKNGHHWHLCPVHKKIVIGMSDHSVDTNTCTCEIKGDK